MTHQMTKLYTQDGTGRDSYIFFNNGGFYPAQSRFLVNRMAESWAYGSPSSVRLGGSIEKRQFYFSDGTGRDTYIAKTVQNKAQLSPDFQETLRKYKSQQLPIKYPYKLPPIKQAVQYEKSVKQQEFTKRLAAPKKRLEDND
ncbi:unnamed protein product [Paramecium octaurelia]|uniref:Uncharacterized protein n=1 Tax=Paramecium octaurelia TaxID=43137 RepID=A0A8S1UYD6_PAROT|nr:unnamed protein product [Paramecium octaurelia]